MITPFAALPGAVLPGHWTSAASATAAPDGVVPACNAPDAAVPDGSALDGGALGTPLHYGNPLREQRALAAGNAVVDLSNYALLTITGADRLRWLHAMTSQAVADLGAGESCETLLLDPQGRIAWAIRLFDDGDTAWLILDPGCAPDLYAYLQRMRFALRVEITDVSASYAPLLACAGGTALPALHEMQPQIIWRDPWQQVSPGGAQYARGERPEWQAAWAVFPRAHLAQVVDHLSSSGVEVAGTLALNALEIMAWRPSFSYEVDERTIPHELDWLRTAVHLQKGCYRGQETVAKVHNIGHPPRRLVLLHLDGSAGELPLPGDPVFAAVAPADPGKKTAAGKSSAGSSRALGHITRSGLHYEWGPVALALIKRTVSEQAELVIAATPPAQRAPIAAKQQIIVPRDAGATRQIPKLPRLQPR